MKILRTGLFSNKEDNKGHSKKDPDNAGINILAGTGLVIAGKKGNQILGEKMMDVLRKEDSEEGYNLLKKLKKVANEQGTNVEHSIYGNSVYGSKGAHEAIKRWKKSNIRKLRQSGEGLEMVIGEAGKAGDSINSVKRADIFSHELGHSKHYQGRDGSAIGKAAHKLLPAGRFITSSPIGAALVAANGYSSGRKAAIAESKGEKESKFNKYRAAGLPIVATLPILTAEGAASVKGLEELKKAGASKKYLKSARGNLTKALGTYATAGLVATGTGVVSRGIGKAATKNKLEKKRKKKKMREE